MASDKKRKKKKKRSGDILYVLFIVAMLGVIGVSGWKIVSTLLEYKAGTDAYQNITETFVTEETQEEAEEEPIYGEELPMEEMGIQAVPEAAVKQAGGGTLTSQKSGSGSTGSAGEAAVEEEVLAPGPNAGQYPNTRVNYGALTVENPQIVCWLNVPALGIQYPVVQGPDDDVWLYTTFEGKRNSAGSIFMDSGNNPALTDKNTAIYGHNMKNGSMFGTLKRFANNRGLAASNPYFYLTQGGRTIQYRIVAYYPTTAGSWVYTSPGSAADYDAYIVNMMNTSAYHGLDMETLIANRPNIVTLSTCHGTSGGSGRFVVQGVAVSAKANNE